MIIGVNNTNRDKNSHKSNNQLQQLQVSATQAATIVATQKVAGLQ